MGCKRMTPLFFVSFFGGGEFVKSMLLSKTLLGRDWKAERGRGEGGSWLSALCFQKEVWAVLEGGVVVVLVVGGEFVKSILFSKSHR